jgi:hypothetical protein
MKNLIVGGASNYTWDQLKYWVNSIKMTGFEGDIVLVGTNYKKETIEKLSQEGVKLSLYGNRTPNGDITSPTSSAPHVERFFHIWNFLHTTKEKYGYVVTTDTRDVIFQSDPTLWLDDYILGSNLVASSEGMTYKNEPWGNQNLEQTFGPFFHGILKERTIYNVGTIGGDFEYVKDLMLMIFQLSINRPIPIVDQAVYNYILSVSPYKDDTFYTNNSDKWAIQLGTTIEAVKAGKGDLGAMFMRNPSDYEAIYEDNQPVIEDGIVKNVLGEKYCIVHQYDRVPGLREQIERIYG